jgi:hypothetical protein
MRRKSAALLVVVSVGAALLSVGAVTAAADDTGLAITVTQSDDGNATVTVTENETAVVNSTVIVETATNKSYTGVGEYLTDENGTVGLAAPENETIINVTAAVGNKTAITETTLTAATGENESEQSFGQTVSAFVQSLTNGTDNPIGYLVSDFVLENNSAADKIPGHAGPPENQTGPPTHASPDNESDRGPPAHAGPDGDDDRGPPEDAGPNTDDEEQGDVENEQETEENTEQPEEGESKRNTDDDERGPPAHAGPP